MKQPLRSSPTTQLIFQEAFRSRHWFYLVAVATVVINLLALATSWFAINVYDKVVPTLDFDLLWQLVGIMAVVILIDWLLKRWRAKLLDRVSSQVEQTVSGHVFCHIMQLRLDQQPLNPGVLISQFSVLDSARQLFSASVVFTLIDLPFALLFIGFIALIGGHIAWVYSALFPVALMLGLYTQRRLHQVGERQQDSGNQRQSLLMETVLGAETIRSHHAGSHFIERWQTQSAEVSDQGLHQKACHTFGQISSGSLAISAYVLALLVGIYGIAQQELSMGSLIACSILGGRVITPVAQCSHYLAQWQQVGQGLNGIDQLLALESDSNQQDSDARVGPTGVLAVDNLTYSYTGAAHCALDIKNLRFQPGERVVILGTIGSGKSTLLKLLAGLYPPSQGTVSMDGQPVKKLGRGILGYLPQQVQLFQGTLRSNLSLGGIAEIEQMETLCHQLGLDPMLDGHPDGLDRPIFINSSGLSGGQQQLVGFARLCLSRPKVWFLDEPTAALDGQSERRLLNHLQQSLRPDHTLLLSTHKPSIASAIATRVIVMDRGRIIADGDVQEVLGAGRPQPSPTAGAAI